ncbi:hypothetical protein [Limosilactobacillus albertensis]|uniref:Uncharacterized protein n=1 Tax=Limosilactobacillus albertensis TaxID=2759752 RepID=A0A839GYP2_9LACO|nr:hypothetical protein [Limosilactobacillus albertensis]MBB1122801.1 hypothetical protein [Limosilactobacillus albertensis]MCD7122555.1 hypothetical protein [Limosilactobacillus albertensis]
MMSDEELNTLKFYNYQLEMVDELESMLKDSDVSFDGKNRGEAFEELQDLAFDRDLTGNRTGSYWCNELKSERALLGNFDLVQDALDDFGMESISSPELVSGEHLDVLVREYLLPAVIDDVLDKHNIAPF